MAVCVSRCSTILFAKRWKNAAKCENNNYIFEEHHLIPYKRCKKSRHYIYNYGLGLVVAISCYLNSLHGDFVHDDIFAITKNPDVRAITPFREIFKNDFWGKSMSQNTSHKSYRPLCVLSFRLNHAVSGLRPLPYHAVNVGLHGAVTMAFSLLCGRLFRRPASRLAAVILFAVHPIHTEAVSGVVGRADVLCCLLFLASFLTYIRSIHCGSALLSAALFSVSLVLAAAAMLSKEQGVTVLAVCVLYDISNHRRHQYKKMFSLLTRCGVVCLVVCILLSVRVWLMNGDLPAFSKQDNPASFSPHRTTRFLTYCYLCAFNMHLLLAPVSLSYDWQMHSIPLVENWTDVRNIATALFFLTTTALIHRCAFQPGENRNRLAVGLSLLIIPFLPAANIFFRVGFVVAERILYIPSMGYVVLVVHGWECLSSRCRHRCHAASLLAAAFVCLILLLALRTVRRTEVWTSRQTLFRSGLLTLPHNAKMHYNYANLLKDMGQHEQAKLHYIETIRLWPPHASAYNNLGTLASTAASDAESHYRAALRINPCHANACFNLANLLSNRGEKMAAMEYLRVTTIYDPTSSAAHTNLAALLSEAKQYPEALEHYKKAVLLNPHGSIGFDNLFVFLENRGILEEGTQTMKLIYTQDAMNYLAWRTHAKILKSLGKLDDARQFYERALDISRDRVTINEVALHYLKNGEKSAALQLLSEAARRFPTDGATMCNYALVLIENGDLTEAETTLKQYLNNTPGDTAVSQQLASVYGEMGRHEQAVALLEETVNSVNEPLRLALLFSDLANHQKDMAQLELARQNYIKALDYNPMLVNAQHNLAVIYHMKADAANAMLHYEAAKRLQPGNKLLEENIQKLMRARRDW